MWPYVWIAFMLGLIIATSVVAMREKKARDAAIQKMKPKNMPGAAGGPIISAEDGFGQADPLDGFDDPNAVGAFDENSFK
jgi:hypothetical protein